MKIRLKARLNSCNIIGKFINPAEKTKNLVQKIFSGCIYQYVRIVIPSYKSPAVLNNNLYLFFNLGFTLRNINMKQRDIEKRKNNRATSEKKLPSQHCSMRARIQKNCLWQNSSKSNEIVRNFNLICLYLSVKTKI